MVRQVLHSVLRRPATVLYPFVKTEMPDRFRGRLEFYSEKCIGCKLCMRDCPTGAVEIRKVGEKQFEAEIDFGKCIYCGQCVDVCPKKALEATKEFELAQLQRGKLRVVFHAKPKPQAAESAGASAQGKPAAPDAGTPPGGSGAGPADAPGKKP
jgi:formate hydrogenlyase subunit 6/NADH:ubiquinone oxidoreductase subunit I